MKAGPFYLTCYSLIKIDSFTGYKICGRIRSMRPVIKIKIKLIEVCILDSMVAHWLKQLPRHPKVEG